MTDEHLKSSKIVHPTLHISDAKSYCFSTREISGALYHLDPMWLDKHLYFLVRSSLLLSSLSDMAYLISSLDSDSRSLFFKMLSLVRLEFPQPLPIRLFGRDLARPKSHIFTLQSASINMLAGFKSLWRMLALWRNFMAQIML